MNLLVFVPYPVEGPSNRYRINQYVGYLAEHGVFCDVRPFLSPELYGLVYRPGEWGRKARLLLWRGLQRMLDLLDARRYDAVLVHRECLPVGPAVLEGLIRRMGKPVIYDFDDAIYLPDADPLKNLLKCTWKVPMIVRLADHVIVCNEHLRKYCLALHDRVTVIPTSVDTDQFCLRPYPAEWEPGRPVRLGWVGSHSTARYLERITGALREVARRYPVELVVMGAGREVAIEGVRVVNQQWRLDTEVEAFRSFDIGLYPLEDDEWVQGKTGFKTIQYMAVGVPGVVSAVGANRAIVQDGVNGFLVTTEEEWVGRLARLIENPGLRRTMGMAARQTAVAQYSVQANAPRLLAVLRSVWHRPQRTAPMPERARPATD